MKDTLDRLIDLQTTDIRIVACQKEEEQIPRDLELRASKIKSLEGQVADQAEEAERIRGQVKEVEKQLEEANQLMRRGQARALLVKTQRENLAVQREGEFARKRKGELEFQLKEIATEREAVEGTLKELAASLTQEKEAYVGEKARANERLEALRKERTELEQNRKVAAGLIEAETLTQYERIFKRYRGQAVVKVVAGVCKGCCMTVPPQLYNQVLAQDRIHGCPNCGRIIFVDPA